MLDTPTQGQAAIHRDRLRVMRQETNYWREIIRNDANRSEYKINRMRGDSTSSVFS